jgi:hypothetical protein
MPQKVPNRAKRESGLISWDCPNPLCRKMNVTPPPKEGSIPTCKVCAGPFSLAKGLE